MQHFNVIDASCLYSLHCHTRFRNIGIRYVAAGVETYTLGGMSYEVAPGRYLVGNHFAEGRVDIESKTPVWGICIDLDPRLLAQVVASHLRPDTAHPDLSLATVYQSADHPVLLRHAGETALGRQLQALGAQAKTKPLGYQQVTEEFFWQVATLLVLETGEVLQQLKDIKTLKRPTKIELYRKVTLGKLYLDEHFSESFHVAAVAKSAGMAEYHFFRLFRAVYHISPYQYVLKKRIDLAKACLRQGHSSLTEIALHTGFADVFSFSKAFKKYTGAPPSQFEAGGPSSS